MKKLSLFILVLSLVFVSCKQDDNDVRKTGFDVPELTELNTISFTATVGASGRVYFMLDGGKVAVDWGDGEVTKDIDPGKGDLWRTEFTHKYKTAGDYQIKIWSDEVTFINISSILYAYTELHIGNCPALINATLNSLPEDTSLELNGCPKLEYLNLGNCEKLEAVDVKECSQLGRFVVYTNPNLKSLDLSNNSVLNSLDCFDCGLEDISLPRDISYVNLNNNNLTSISLSDYEKLSFLSCDRNNDLTMLDLTGCENLSSLSFSDTQISELDFSEFLNLYTINCSNTNLTDVDVSKNKKLSTLQCAGLGLTSLDIANIPWLERVNCGNNKLTALDVSKNTGLRYLHINENELDKDNLEAIFTALPKSITSTRSNLPPPYPSVIAIYGNPGVGACDTKIIIDKGWMIVE